MKLQSNLMLQSIMFLLLPFTFADLNSDSAVLLDFAAKVLHARRLNWNDTGSVCTSWVGIACNAERTRVIAIRLPGVGFNGPLPRGIIGKLDALMVLSLRSNHLTGDLPSDIPSIPALQYLYLQQNNFSGNIPDSFSPRLTALDLSFNSFQGNIPPTMRNLTRLTALNLQNNLLSGNIPGDLNLKSIQLLNLSHNKLIGRILQSLEKFPSSSFVGNSLCGRPLGECSMPVLHPPSLAYSPSPQELSQTASPVKTKLSTGAIISVVAGCVSLLSLIVIVIVFFYSNSKDDDGKTDKMGKESKVRKSYKPKEDFGSGAQEAEKNMLVFFEGSNFNFDLEDLLRASAEVLGKGSYGTSYRAILDEGIMLVVKRLKEVGIGKREFEQQMDVIGNIGKHPNIVSLRAYYYSKDEKLLVSDYIDGGSLASLLHGNRGGNGRHPLDWNTRLRISLAAARGILHIHSQGGGRFIHGNIKSSNILLTLDLNVYVSNFGMATLMNFHPVTPKAVGYHAPEVVESRKATQKSDVYSFGVLLLELLTGKAPVKSHGQNDAADLPRWVQSTVREEWTSEVFDAELIRSPNTEEEMVQMLQIALSCVAGGPDMRPQMDKVVRMIEDIRMEEQPSSEDCRSKDSNVCTP